VQICLWGDDNFSNLTALLVEPGEVDLLVLADRQQHRQIAAALEHSGHQLTLLHWPQLAGREDFARLDQQLTARPTSLNATGGNREQAMSLLLWARDKGIESFVIDHCDRRIWLYPERPAEAVADIAGLAEYFSLANISLLGQGPGFEVTRAVRSMVNDWVLAQYPLSAYRQLNRLAASAEPCEGGYRVSFGKRRPRGVLAQLIGDLATTGLLHREKTGLSFASEAMRGFCNGGWLELYVYDRVRKLRARCPHIQDIRHALQIAQPEGVRNELDIVFLANNQLHLIEVKTAYLLNRVEAANQIVYKLDALANLLGREVKAMVISLSPLPKTSLKRASSFDLEVISDRQLPGLDRHLERWINSTISSVN